ncbi:RteC protein, partial [Dysgonomonas sp. 521]|uniref:RteC domain-containing protein n=1 Tax=Dysgonomonas sp. 521 TaxID=2302932 RepID=UPI0013D48C08
CIENGTGSSIIEKSREAILLLEDTLDRLKVFICEYSFTNQEEEITFFKELKPSLSCQLLYYRKVYDIGVNCPQGGRAAQRAYLEGELEAIRLFFSRHREFYRYYRSGSRHFDCYYFLRGISGIQSAPDFCFDKDPEFSSGGDRLVSRILAYDMLEARLIAEIDRIDEDAGVSGLGKAGLFWTISKTDLTEVAFPLFLVEAFNGGKITQMEYRRRIEKAFNIDLSNFSRALHDMKNRSNPTQFLDKLKKALLDYLDEERDDNLK